MKNVPLEFIGDAIKLSGLTGTKLKCTVIGEYYNFWWNITSGGRENNYRFPTAIVELDAATGEVYIEDTNEIVLGSAGHSLALKATNPNTWNLKVVLIEKNANCYTNLKKVIQKRWPTIKIDDAEKPITKNDSNVYLFNLEFDDAINQIKQIELGNSLFFFDPLRSVTLRSVETVAQGRLERFYQTGTEFMIFIFTSDWFLGRDYFAPLPNTIDESKWSEAEKNTINEADSLFGTDEWRQKILIDESIEKREIEFIELYKNRLHKWFRYVLPLPFNPKANQLFHLILCSNYETGVRMTKGKYSKLTGNPPYKPDNLSAYEKFKRLHPRLTRSLKGRSRPDEWRILWKIITQHEEGLCDCKSRDLVAEAKTHDAQTSLEWLKENEYLIESDIKNAWNSDIRQYVLNWPHLKNKLGIEPPLPLRPLSPEMLKNGRP